MEQTYKGYSFLSAYIKMWKNFADFNGRATRQEFWGASVLDCAVQMLGCFIFIPIMFIDRDIYMAATYVACSIYFFASLLPVLAVSVRRLHDVGQSGLVILISFIPFVGELVLLIFYCLDSQRGTNKYGESEKYPDKQ